MKKQNDEEGTKGINSALAFYVRKYVFLPQERALFRTKM
jgi:hypothetical protein